MPKAKSVKFQVRVEPADAARFARVARSRKLTVSAALRRHIILVAMVDRRLERAGREAVKAGMGLP